MNLEQQVCSLDLAKRLKELGVKQSSHLTWVKVGITNNWNLWTAAECLDRAEEMVVGQRYPGRIAAFTVAELGEMLPTSIPDSEPITISRGLFGYGKTAENQWQCMYYDVKFFNAATEADARAKMLVYLLEKKLIEI